MTKDFETPDNGDEVRPDEQGSGAHASDPASQEPELTIDDILSAAQSADAADASAEASIDAAQADLLNDLKRVQAEYANYRRRTDEQRELEIDRAKGSVAKGLLPVLDDLDRAQKHGDLVEGTPFSALAEKLRGVAARQPRADRRRPRARAAPGARLRAAAGRPRHRHRRPGRRAGQPRLGG